MNKKDCKLTNSLCEAIGSPSLKEGSHSEQMYIDGYKRGEYDNKHGHELSDPGGNPSFVRGYKDAQLGKHSEFRRLNQKRESLSEEGVDLPKVVTVARLLLQMSGDVLDLSISIEKEPSLKTSSKRLEEISEEMTKVYREINTVIRKAR
jgi:hypothetical protein